MPECEHYEVCRRDAEENTEEGLCILHSRHPKDYGAFALALTQHRKKNGDNFRYFVFPGLTDFSGVTFAAEADFSGATFEGEGNFSEAQFTKEAQFSGARFEDEANFEGTEFFEGADFERASFGGLAYFAGAEFAKCAHFTKVVFSGESCFCAATLPKGANFTLASFINGADFSGAKFIDSTGGANILPDSSVIDSEEAVFCNAVFAKWANFDEARFGGGVNFSRARFKEGAIFSGTWFATRASFFGTTFLGRTLFASSEEEEQTDQVFSGTAADFRDVIIEPLDALAFRNADVHKCRFLYTDLRKVEFTNVKWPQKHGHFKVYDESYRGMGLVRGRILSNFTANSSRTTKIVGIKSGLVTSTTAKRKCVEVIQRLRGSFDFS